MAATSAKPEPAPAKRCVGIQFLPTPAVSISIAAGKVTVPDLEVAGAPLRGWPVIIGTPKAPRLGKRVRLELPVPLLLAPIPQGRS